jgi:hypothetical protein
MRLSDSCRTGNRASPPAPSSIASITCLSIVPALHEGATARPLLTSRSKSEQDRTWPLATVRDAHIERARR